jgi:hypothetical protein
MLPNGIRINIHYPNRNHDFYIIRTILFQHKFSVYVNKSIFNNNKDDLISLLNELTIKTHKEFNYPSTIYKVNTVLGYDYYISIQTSISDKMLDTSNTYLLFPINKNEIPIIMDNPYFRYIDLPKLINDNYKVLSFDTLNRSSLGSNNIK